MKATTFALAGLLIAAGGASPAAAQEDGTALYEQNCASCHGATREGQGPFPSLVGVGDRLDAGEIDTVIREGRGLMPPFAQLTDAEREALVTFLQDG